MIETPALPPGAWGRGRACGSGTGGSACARMLIRVELSMAQAQPSAEVDAAPDQGTGSLCGALCFPGQAPFPPVSALTGQTGEAAVMPATLCSYRAQATLLPGARGSSGNTVRWQLDLCAQSGRQVPFLATGERRGSWQVWAVRLACSQQRGCQGIGHSEPANSAISRL